MTDRLSGPVDVLCVNDEPDSAELTAIYLERIDERFAVETALDARAGLEYLEDNAVDCVVSGSTTSSISILAWSIASVGGDGKYIHS